MKHLFSAVLFIILFAACNKSGDINVKQDAVVTIKLNSFEPNQYEQPADSISFRFNPRYSKAVKPGEDTLNRAKQANDLHVVESNQMLQVDALPVAYDSIPLGMFRLIGTEYRFKFEFSNVPDNVEVWYIEKVFEGETGTNWHLKYTLMSKNNPVTYPWYNNGEFAPSDRYSIVFKEKPAVKQ